MLGAISLGARNAPAIKLTAASGSFRTNERERCGLIETQIESKTGNKLESLRGLRAH